jgi:hypothetical protein
MSPYFFNLQAAGFATAKTEAIIAQTNFDGIAQGSEADYFHLLAFKQTHFHQTLDERIVSLDCDYPASLTGM